MTEEARVAAYYLAVERAGFDHLDGDVDRNPHLAVFVPLVRIVGDTFFDAGVAEGRRQAASMAEGFLVARQSPPEAFDLVELIRDTE